MPNITAKLNSPISNIIICKYNINVSYNSIVGGRAIRSCGSPQYRTPRRRWLPDPQKGYKKWHGVVLGFDKNNKRCAGGIHLRIVPSAHLQTLPDIQIAHNPQKWPVGSVQYHLLSWPQRKPRILTRSLLPSGLLRAWRWGFRISVVDRQDVVRIADGLPHSSH